MSESSRLKWQCRRGMRELDELLLRWLDTQYDNAPPKKKSAFAALLELPDPVLAGYLLLREQPGSGAIADIVSEIRGIDPS